MISVLLPTRKRPQNLERMVDSIFKTAKNFPEIVIYVDDDDTESAAKVEALGQTLIVGPRITMSDYWNKCYDRSTGDIVMQCGDDVLFRTKDWDVLVEQAFAEVPDKILLVHGNDLDPWFPDFGTHSFVHRRWVDTVGYFIPPWFVSDYGDTWIGQVAKLIERMKYVPIITEHMHPRANKAQLDETYQQRLNRQFRDGRNFPGEVYTDTFEKRLEDAEKLKAVIDRFTETAA